MGGFVFLEPMIGHKRVRDHGKLKIARHKRRAKRYDNGSHHSPLSEGWRKFKEFLTGWSTQ